MDRAWVRCLKEAETKHRFNVDAAVRRALTGHVTEEMQRKYSTVGIDEKRAAVAGVIRLVRRQVGTQVGSEAETKKAG